MRLIVHPFSDLSTLTEAWLLAVQRWPHQHAVVSEAGVGLTYLDAHRRIGVAARQLYRGGLQPGDTVHLVLPLTLDGWCMLWAAWRLGLLAVLLDPQMTASALRDRLALCPPRLIVTIGARAGEFDALGVPVMVPDVGEVDRIPSAVAQAPRCPTRSSGPAAAGDAKAVLHAPGALLHSGGCSVPHYGWQPGLRITAPAGLHTIGAMRLIVGAVLSGATFVMWPPAGSFHPRLALRHLRERSIHHLQANPSFYRLLVDPRAGDIGPRPVTIQVLGNGGGDIPAGLRDTYRRLWGIGLWNHLGSTETASFIASESSACDGWTHTGL